MFAHVAEHDGEVAGFALWFLNYSTWQCQQGIYLEDLYVRPELREQATAASCSPSWPPCAWSAGTAGSTGRAGLEQARRGFYARLGATRQDEWTTHRLTGAALRELAAARTAGDAGLGLPARGTMDIQIGGVNSTDLFGGTAAEPRQIIRVRLINSGPDLISDPRQPVTVEVTGRGVSTPEPVVVTGLEPGAEPTAEVAVRADAQAGAALPVLATASFAGRTAAQAAHLTVAEPGWTMWMVSHFHYDPVWWSTQGQFTESRLLLPDEDGALPDVRTAFELVRLHLDAARARPRLQVRAGRDRLPQAALRRAPGGPGRPAGASSRPAGSSSSAAATTSRTPT